MDILNALFRWLHILAGIIWIGLLYFFNWVNAPFAATMDGDTKKKVVPELMPRVLFWFRWGAAWTWITGVLLLFIVFYHEKTMMFGADGNWTAGAIVMLALTFLAPFVYDALQKSGLGKNPKVFGTAAFVLMAVVIALMFHWARFGYRAFNIHMGALLGTTMAFNVWFRIWPGQKKVIAATKEGAAPDAALVAFVGTRSRHNVYMSVPLLWAMIDHHTEGFAGDRFGISSHYAFGVFLVVTLLAWHIVWQLYRKAPKVKGF